MANPEMMAKANEKRMTALEKKLDTFEKEFRKSGDVSSILKRVVTLEAAVKALAVTAKSANADDAKVNGEIAEIRKRIDDRTREIDQIARKEGTLASKKIADLEKRKDILEKTVIALNGRTDREKKAHEAAQEKLEQDVRKQTERTNAEMKAITDQQKRFVEKTILESRLKTLEGMVQAALAK